MRYLLISLFLLSCSSDEVYKVKEFESPAGENSSLPRLYTDNSGTVFMSWVETQSDTTKHYFSSLIDGSWNEPTLIGSSNNWFVNWADFPSLIAYNGKALAAHRLNKVKGGTYAYDVELVTVKGDWSNTESPHNDETPTEHGFVSMVPVSDSTFLSVWLDGRNTLGDGSHNETNTALLNAMTLRSALLDLDLNLINEFEIDNNVCDCCGTATVGTENGFITAYRNRTKEEIRDIYVSRYVNSEWTEPKNVSNDGWKIAACPVNGPAIDARGKMIALAWYTGANNIENVKLAISLDEGDTFKKPIIIDNRNPVGRVDLTIINEETILVSWIERNLEDRSKANFIAKTISIDGSILNEYKISTISSSRRSGFPQISNYKNKIIAAWTDLDENTYSQIKTAILE